VRGSPQTLHDSLAADSLLDELLDLLQYLSGDYDNRGGTIANFGILRSCDVGQDAGGGVNNVEELRVVSTGMLGLFYSLVYLHDGGAIVGDRLPSILVHHEQVTAIWP
jgi:hypothetical protein